MSINPFDNVDKEHEVTGGRDTPPEDMPQVEEKQVSKSHKVLLKAVDEFTNDKTARFTQRFHQKLKNELKDPNVMFLLLRNVDITNEDFKCLLANDPNLEGKIFVLKPDPNAEENLRSLRQKDSDMPELVKIVDAESLSFTNDENGTHYPTDVLKYSNNSYWYSDNPKPKTLKLKFDKLSRVKYVGINFHNPEHLDQTFDLLYRTSKRDPQTGEVIVKEVVTGAQNLKLDSIQFIKFNEPILTHELYLRVTSEFAAINYVIGIKNDLSDEALEMVIDQFSK